MRRHRSRNRWPRTPNAGGETLFVRSCVGSPIRAELTLFVLVVALALVMSIVYPNNFPTAPNMRAVLLNSAPVGILVCGMMLLMIGGTFDLSVGSTLAFSGVWAGVVAGWWGWPAEVARSGRHPGGALCGLVNGLIVTRIGINALIATLGTLTIYRSLTYVTAGTGVTPIGDAFAAYGRAADPLLRIQSPFWAMLVHRADRRLAGRAHALLPPVLFHRRQSARGAAFGHPRRSPDPDRLRHHGRAGRPRRRARRRAPQQRGRQCRRRHRAQGHHRHRAWRRQPEGRRGHDPRRHSSACCSSR